MASNNSNNLPASSLEASGYPPYVERFMQNLLCVHPEVHQGVPPFAHRGTTTTTIQGNRPAVTSQAAIIVDDDESPSSVNGDEAHELEPNTGDSEEEQSSDDDLPAISSWKRPVGPAGSTGAGKGKGKWPASAGVVWYDAVEEQEVVEEDEAEEANDDDDDDDDEYAPARRVRRARPPNVSAAPAAAIGSRKAITWSAAEDQACIVLMQEVCTQARYAAIAGTERRFEVIAARMRSDHGFNRSASGVKLQWNRRLRAISGFEDRGDKKHSGSGLTTSSLNKGASRPAPAASSSVAAAPSTGTNSVVPPAATHGSTSRKTKRKVYISSDDEDEEDDDDFIPAPPPSKRARTSSSTIPSTQDVAYYDISNENIISGTRSSRRQEKAPAQPVNQSRQKRPITIGDDDDDDEDFAISSARPKRQRIDTTSSTSRPSRRSQKQAITIPSDDEDDEPIKSIRQKRAHFLIKSDDEDDEPIRSVRQKRSRTIIDSDEDDGNDNNNEPTTTATEPKRKTRPIDRNFDWGYYDRYSLKDGHLLKRSEVEYWNPKLHTKVAPKQPSPEPVYNSKAYWEKVLMDRQARVAAERAHAERNAVEDDDDDDEEEDDEEPIVSSAAKAKKSRELRKKASAVRQYSPRLSAVEGQIEEDVDTPNNDNDNEDFENDEVAQDAEDAEVAEEDDEVAAQMARDEEFARQLQAELNGGNARVRRSRGFN